MSTFLSYDVPSGEACFTGKPSSGTSSSEVVLGNNALFIFVSDTDSNIKFGVSGMGAAAITDLYIPAKTFARFDLGANMDRVRIFNTTAGTNGYTIQKLGRN